MAKSGKKQGLKRAKASANKASTKKAGKKAVARKAAKKRAGAKVPSLAAHNVVFSSLTARSNQHNLAPVCYQQLGGGGWLVCYLQSDGSYGQCQPYSGPVHEPRCG